MASPRPIQQQERAEWRSLFDDPLTETYSDDGQLGDSSVWECGGTNGGDCETGDGTVTLDGDDSTSTESESSSSGTIGLLFSPGDPTDCFEGPDGKEVCDPGGGGDDSDGSDGGGGDDTDDGGSIGDGGGGFDPIDDGTSATNETDERTIQFPNAALIELEYELFAEAVGDDAAARFVIETESGGKRTVFSVSGPDASDKGVGTLDLKQYGGEEVTFRLIAENESTLTAEKFRLTYDTDGDGLTDAEERNGMRTGLGQTIQTDPTENDTDGDGLDDDEEMGEPRAGPNGDYYTITSDPTDQDTDDDALDDATEINGWNLTVIENEEGDPYKWAGNQTSGENVDNISLTSDPRKVDTDSDGLTDATEKRDTHTDPREQRTYDITREHQKEVVNALAENEDRAFSTWMARGLGLIEQDQSLRELENKRLTDRNDDFDLVTTEGENVTSRITFQALDYNQRSDTWLSNVEESRHGTDPWDPDTDDDGLTDGQEVKYVTKFDQDLGLRADRKATTETSALSPDSDGDGHWDGWIGVYGVGRTDNVILYFENLHSGDGLAIDQIVTNQIKVHNVSEAPSAMGADVDGDGSKEHSHLHLGELHWGSDPNNPDSEPDTSLKVEVDWLEGNNPYNITTQQNGSPISVIESVERNMAIYGINVTFVRDDRIQNESLEDLGVRTDSQNAWGLSKIQNEYHDDKEAMHLLFAKQYEDRDTRVFKRYLPHDRGIPEEADGLTGHTGSPGHVKFLEEHLTPYGVVVMAEDPDVQSFISTKKVFTHEMGHAFSIGWKDDRELYTIDYTVECYSGSICARGPGSDGTPEPVRFNGNISDTWSVMGLGDEVETIEINRISFSIEELSTVDKKDVPSKDD